MNTLLELLIDEVIDYRTRQIFDGGLVLATYAGCVLKKDFGSWRKGDVIAKIDVGRTDKVVWMWSPGGHQISLELKGVD